VARRVPSKHREPQLLDFYRLVPKGFEDNLLYRVKLRKQCESDPLFRHAITEACRHDILFFFNAFCLAEGTLVVTDRGPVPIEWVTSLHHVWDGSGWVKPKAVVPMGLKKTIWAYGVRLTPDHKVATKQGWSEAGNRYEREPAELPPFYPEPWRQVRGPAMKTVEDDVMPVYDIVGCGPNESFTVIGNDKKPLLVHNCWLHEPRPMLDSTGRPLPEVIPFITWPHQDVVIRQIREHLGYEDIGCLSGDTGVVSSRGVVRIKDIRNDDLIWDGDNFVRHGGVVSQGVKSVIRAYGLTLTPDHLVLTKDGWRHADQRIGRAAVRMPGGYGWDSQGHEVQVRLRGREGVPASGRDEGGSLWREPKLRSLLCAQNEVNTFARNGWKARKGQPIQRLGGYGWKVYQAVASRLRLLRWAWDNGVREVAQLYRLLGGHEGLLFSGPNLGSHGQQPWLLQRELQVGYEEGPGKQQEKQSLGGHGPRHHDRISSGGVGWDQRVFDEREVGGRLAEREVAYEEVFDILDCGPNNRFVVIGDEPTIVHNCEKSRGEGMTWIALMTALHDWIFSIPGTRMVTIGIASRTLEMADSPSDISSLMAKLDWELDRLPSWMVGARDVDYKRMYKDRTLRNLKNNCVITAYAGTGECGSGGRYTWWFLDELSKFNPGDDRRALTSTQATTKSRLIVGTPYGSEGAYYDIMHEPSSMIKLTLKWEDNPTRNKGLYRMIGGIPVAMNPASNPLPWSYSPPSPDVQAMFARLRAKGFRLERGLRSPWYDHECDRPDANAFNIAQELDRDYGGSMYKIFTEDFHQEARASVRPPFCRVSVLYDSELQPHVSRDPIGDLLLWVTLDLNERPPKHEYVLGVDISTGLGGTYTSNSVIEIIDATTMEQAGELAVNTIPPDKLADLSVAICNWLGGAYLAWERNGPGSAYTARIKEINYPNVYLRTKLFDKRRRKKLKEPGWWSDTKTKEVMFSEFRRIVAAKELTLRSEDLIKESHQYIRVGAKIEHIANVRGDKEGPDRGEGHGDRIIAMGIAIQALRDRPTAISRAASKSKVIPGSIEERDLAFAASQRSFDDWDDRSNWDLMSGNKMGTSGW
jgi:hypothetical protein